MRNACVHQLKRPPLRRRRDAAVGVLRLQSIHHVHLLPSPLGAVTAQRPPSESASARAAATVRSSPNSEPSACAVPLPLRRLCRKQLAAARLALVPQGIVVRRRRRPRQPVRAFARVPGHGARHADARSGRRADPRDQSGRGRHAPGSAVRRRGERDGRRTRASRMRMRARAATSSATVAAPAVAAPDSP